MVDPNNQRYYELDAAAPTALAPAFAPWWRRRESFARVGVFALAAALLALGGTYAYQTFTLGDEREAASEAERVAGEIASRCAGAADPAACTASEAKDAAEATGNAKVCLGLAGNALFNCVTLTARASLDPSACDELPGDVRGACADAVNLAKAQADGDYARCASIGDTSLRENCEDILIDVVIASGACATYGVSADACTFPARLETAIASGNPQSCDAFVGDDRESCEDAFTSTDRDEDGLSRQREYELGTSDDNPDTDGDGFDDGTEVTNGYDPLK